VTLAQAIVIREAFMSMPVGLFYCSTTRIFVSVEQLHSFYTAQAASLKSKNDEAPAITPIYVGSNSEFQTFLYFFNDDASTAVANFHNFSTHAVS
jgi:hypothetical protein